MWLIASPSFLTFAVVMTVLGLLKAVYFGALPSVMSDVFPVHSRATGPVVRIQLTTAIFGGFTPTIAAALVAATGQAVSPGYYILAVSLVSIAALIGAVRIRGIR